MVVLKLDLTEAYDRADWDFLDFAMAHKGVAQEGEMDL